VKYLSSFNSFNVLILKSTEAFLTKKIEIKIKKMFDLDIDTINILSEKMRRRRDARKQIYLIALSHLIESEINSYHIAFFAFINVSAFYNARTNANTVLTNVEITLFHKDALSLESKNFRQM
jgi:hypothetical protein